MSAPAVYKAITAITADLSGVGIAKRHRNERVDYRYRSIDDVLNRLSPLLAKHRLCVLPRVLERTSSDRVGDGDLLLVGVTLRVAFDLVSSVDGSSHTVEAFAEALDASDKATAKAMSSAYKHAMLQAFCVPVAQIEDADAGSYRLKRSRSHQQEPVEGWAMWASGITDIVESCATSEALERLQDRQRPLLKAISCEQRDLYAQLGAAFAKRTAELNGEGCATSTAGADGEQCANPKNAKVRPTDAHAARKRAGAARANSADRTDGAARARSASPANGAAPTKLTRRRPRQASTSTTEHEEHAEITEPA
jgi:hypothetical protein